MMAAENVADQLVNEDGRKGIVRNGNQEESIANTMDNMFQTQQTQNTRNRSWSMNC